jgi:hypothetical protein
MQSAVWLAGAAGRDREFRLLARVARQTAVTVTAKLRWRITSALRTLHSTALPFLRDGRSPGEGEPRSDRRSAAPICEGAASQ